MFFFEDENYEWTSRYDFLETAKFDNIKVSWYTLKLVKSINKTLIENALFLSAKIL